MKRQRSPSAGPPGGDAAPARSPLGIVKALFTHHVKLRRSDEGMRVVLEAKGAAPAKAARPPHGDADALAMHVALRAVLDDVPGSRRVLGHLATVERELWKRGALFIHELPLPTLRTMLRQLDGLGGPSRAPALNALRARLEDAILVHERHGADASRGAAGPSSFLVADKLHVAEARPSDFIRASADPETGKPR